MTAATLPIHLAFWQRTAIGLVLLAALLPALAIAWSFGISVLMARARRAVGPADAGPGGSLQPLADLGRAVQTEDRLPVGAAPLLADLALGAAVLAVFGVTALVPVGPHQVAAAPTQGVLVALVLLGAFAGACRVADGRAPSLHGDPSERGIAAAAAFAVLAMAGASVAAGARSASVPAIVHAQQSGSLFGWDGVGQLGIVVHPLAFVAFVAALAELVHVGPFRHEVASDPVAATTGLRRWHWGWIRWAALLAGSATAATWFLGGWALPGHSSGGASAAFGPMLVAVKTLVLAAAIASTEVAWPSLGADDRSNLVLRWLLPLAALDLAVTLVVKASW